jgi:NAD(P)-dependent dehydrogenase (short-subunit alcohol dehydrogenase family)
MTRTVLITGAGRGIGHEMARQCALRGDVVLGTARSPEGRAAIDRLRSVGDVTSFGADVTDAGRLGELAHMLSDRTLDLLVCNAGALIGRGGIDDPAITPEAFSTVLMANVAGPLFTVRAFLPHLRRAGAAKVAVITSSMGSSTRAKGTSYMYRASKAGATNLALNLAAELAGMGIAVGAWHPGWVRTDLGGAGAEIDATESVTGLLARFDALSLATTGAVEDYAGVPLPI